jgi:sugar phosphate permease
MSTANTADTLNTLARDRTHSTITWRLMPLLICYLFAHLDRINIGFAKMQMSADLNFSDTVYGLGAGLFFIAYALFGVPSNLALDRVGPRRWIATLMVVWGALSTCMLLIDRRMGFYAFASAGGRSRLLPGHPGVSQPLVSGRPPSP